MSKKIPPQLYSLFALFSLVVAVIFQVSIKEHSRLATALLLIIGLLLWATVLYGVHKSFLKARVLLLAIAIALTGCIAFPPATSKDVNSYAMYGRMVSQYDSSPYTHVPRDFPGDVWYPRVSYFWNDSPSVYGPVFTGVSAGVMGVANTSFTTARLCFQAVAGLALLACVALAYRRSRQAEVLVLIGLNPILLTFGVNDAHADLLVGLGVLAACLMLTRRRLELAGVAIALAVLVKVSAAPALAGAAVWIWFKWGRAAAARLVVPALVVVGAGLALAGGRDELHPLSDASKRHTRFSLWNPLHSWLPANHADAIVGSAASVVVAVVGLALICRHRNDALPVVGVVVGLVAYQVLGAYTLGWYVAWSLPALALAWRSRVAVIALGHAALISIAYQSGYLGIVALVVVVLWLAASKLTGRRTFPWINCGRQDILAAR